MVVIVFALPRRFALLGIMAGVCYLTQMQQLNLGGFNFTGIRFILLAGLLRVFARGEYKDLKINRIDSVVLSYPIAVTVAYTVRLGTTEALVYQLGCSYDILLSYFVFRSTFNNLDTVQQFIGDLALLIVPLAVLMVYESVTRNNAFGFAVDERYIREGRLRCTGSFRGPITAGIFGATLIPFFVGLFLEHYRRGVMIAGLLAALAITFTSNSSGPLMALLSGIVGFVFWSIRLNMRTVRWGIVAALVCLHVVMKPPVWFLLAKMSNLTGGDGWHRSYVMDQGIRHFWDWCLLGTSDTAEWAATVMSTGQADITNQYLASGVAGGAIAVILFILIIVRCFQGLGRTLEAVRKNFATMEKFFWCCGCALFAHVVTIFSVSYFDQMHVAWWAFIALISASTAGIASDQADPGQLKGADGFPEGVNGQCHQLGRIELVGDRTAKTLW